MKYFIYNLFQVITLITLQRSSEAGISLFKMQCSTPNARTRPIKKQQKNVFSFNIEWAVKNKRVY